MILPIFHPARSGFHSRRFWKWINTIFNKVDFQRIKDVGPDRAAAEWLLRCGASVKWQNDSQWITDYNDLIQISKDNHKIVEIDATDSCIMNIGFQYLEGLKHLKHIKFCKCIYLEDKCMHKLSVTKDSLQHLQVISCGNISDEGVLAVSELKLLKTIYLYDLPEVKDREQCISVLKQNLPQCKIDFPLVVNSNNS